MESNQIPKTPPQPTMPGTTMPQAQPQTQAKPRTEKGRLNLSELKIRPSTVGLMVGGVVGFVIGFIISLIVGNSIIGGYGFVVGIFAGYGVGYLMERNR